MLAAYLRRADAWLDSLPERLEFLMAAICLGGIVALTGLAGFAAEPPPATMEVTLGELGARDTAELLSGLRPGYVVAINREDYWLMEPVSIDGFVVQPFDRETGETVGKVETIELEDVQRLHIY